jgi:hypothetical protein
MVAFSDREILDYAAQMAAELAAMCRPIDAQVAARFDLSSRRAAAARECGACATPGVAESGDNGDAPQGRSNRRQ